MKGKVLDLENLEATDLSIPLCFNGPQPNAWGVERAESVPVIAGDLIGDTRLGGSVNFERYTFTPHCSGTHTECVGHITHERISIRECLDDILIPAFLVTVEPELKPQGSAGHGDRVLTRDSLESTLGIRTPGIPQSAIDSPQFEALIVRTLPNGDWKKTAEYGEENLPAYFTPDAMDLIVTLGVKHLLVDLPSVDRIFDGGVLVNHRRFWNVEPGSHQAGPGSRKNSTITELIYVPDILEDGEYLLNLQIAPFQSDCSPSRPLLIRRKAG